MFPMRLKIRPSRNNEWRCCFCLHVRTATILLGTWHLLLHVLALSVLAIMMRNHHMTMQREEDTSLDPGNILPTPLSKVKKDEEGPYYLPQDGRPIYSSDMDMSALMTVCTLAITLLLVYGTIKGKASHILPYFCLQLFDFAITTSGHQFVSDHWHNMPFRSELLHLNSQQLSLLVLVTFLMSLFWKAYCISIVWRCYKFLTLRQTAMISSVHYILPGEGSERGPEPDYSTLLPDYESACASTMKQAPPPSYQAAMEGQLRPIPFYPECTPDCQVVGITAVPDMYPRLSLVIPQNNTDNAYNIIEIDTSGPEVNSTVVTENETEPLAAENQNTPTTSATETDEENKAEEVKEAQKLVEDKQSADGDKTKENN